MENNKKENDNIENKEDVIENKDEIEKENINSEVKDEKENNEVESKNENSNEYVFETKKKKKTNTCNEEEKDFSVSFQKSVILFLVGFAGLQLIAYAIGFIIVISLKINGVTEISNEKEMLFNGYIQVFAYGITLVTLFAIIGFANLKYIYKHKDLFEKIGKGIGYGIGLLMISYLWNIISTLIHPTTTINENETAIRSITSIMPIGSFLFVVLFAPITEEITYRLAIFGAAKKYNRYLAYALTALIFGAIHVSWSEFGDMDKEQIINELLNFPSYILSGLYLCYVYDKENNLLSSTIAHMTNNLFAYTVTVIADHLPQEATSSGITSSAMNIISNLL